MPEKKRCRWCTSDPIYIDYHDKEWGRAVHDDKKWFEMLTLESFQAGLNWLTILKRREHFRNAFEDFNPEKIALWTPSHIDKLLQNEKIIRHRKKIEATHNNAKIFLAIQKKTGSFNAYVRQFSNAKDMANNFKNMGFQFFGETTCYALMQACGLVLDHEPECYLYSH